MTPLALTAVPKPGAPARYYDLGHGLCSYTFFEQCPLSRHGVTLTAAERSAAVYSALGGKRHGPRHTVAGR